MKIKGDCPRVTQDILSGDVSLIIRVSPESRRMLDKIKDIKGDLTVDIKKHRPLRSLDANAYLWVLCDKIAKEIGSTKEIVYKEIIRRVGRFDVIAVRSDKADDIIRGWDCRGLGWFAERMDGCKIDGCERIMIYYGSSDYNTKEMSDVIDEAITEAKELGIETLTPDEIEKLKGLWNEKAHKGSEHTS